MIRFIRRYLISKRSFPDEWQKILENKVPYYNILPTNLRDELKKHIAVLVYEKIFEGCGGLEMTENVRLTIAAYAAILLLGHSSDYYPLLNAILVYPDDYYAPSYQEDEAGIITEGVEQRSGESWDHGSIVLSWNDIQSDINEPYNGKNLVFHEFSHQLDDRYGVTAGIDDDGNIVTPNEWNTILAKHYRKLRSTVKRRQRMLLDPYGATHPAEFFAVATESFFDNGYRLKNHHPELYETLKSFYEVDPASYLPMK
jgi:MtfA peptidase